MRRLQLRCNTTTEWLRCPPSPTFLAAREEQDKVGGEVQGVTVVDVHETAAPQAQGDLSVVERLVAVAWQDGGHLVIHGRVPLTLVATADVSYRAGMGAQC